MSTTATAPKSHSKATVRPETFKKMNMVEQAEIVNDLYQDGNGLSQAEISEKVEVSIPQVSNLITLHHFPAAIKEAIREGRLSGTLALQVFRDSDSSEVGKALEKIVKKTEGKITRKDLFKVVNQVDSLSEVKRWLKKNSVANIKDSKEARHIYTLLNGIFRENTVTMSSLDQLLKAAS